MVFLYLNGMPSHCYIRIPENKHVADLELLVSGSVILLSGQQREPTAVIPDHSKFPFHFEDSNSQMYSSVKNKGKDCHIKGAVYFQGPHRMC